MNDYTDDGDKPKVLISFHHEDLGQARLLGYQLESEQNGAETEDITPKRPFKGDWKVKYEAKVAESDVVVVAVGEDTADREAVKWEIKTAKKHGKQVYAVRLHGDEYHRIPHEVYDAGGKVLPWDVERIKYEIHANT